MRSSRRLAAPRFRAWSSCVRRFPDRFQAIPPYLLPGGMPWSQPKLCWVATMQWIGHVATTAPEIFLFLAVAIGTLLGRIRVHGFSLGPTACTLVVAVVLGLFGTITIPGLLKSIFFG